MADYSVLPAGDTALVVDFGNRVDLALRVRLRMHFSEQFA